MPTSPKPILILLIIFLLAACATPTPPPTPQVNIFSTPTIAPTGQADPFFRSDGGGEPRTTGYWLLWNSCASGNKSDVAAANGGRQAGWIILDDLLADPGLQLGDLLLASCPQSLAILNQVDSQGVDKSSDALYQLASQVLAAELNLGAGAETCPAQAEALTAGHLFLASYQFNGQGGYLSLGNPAKERETVIFTAEQLAEYNNGGLCK